MKAHARIADLVRDLTASPELDDDLASAEMFPMDIVTQLFRRAMRELTSGVSVITTGDGDERIGLTATSVTSLAMTPASLLVCVQRSSSAIPQLRKDRGFAVNLLAAEHQPIADHFAGRTGVRGAARFAIGDWQTGSMNVPILGSALAAVECRIARIVDWHTHRVIFGEVTSVRFRDAGDALLYRRGAYEVASPSIVPDGT